MTDSVTDPANPTADIAGGKRQRARDSLFLMAQLRIADEAKLREVRVRNLSEGGLMIEVGKALDVDTRVMLDLRGIGEVTGKVAWYTTGRAGIALDTPIDPKKARKPVVGGSQGSVPTFRAGGTGSR